MSYLEISSFFYVKYFSIYSVYIKYSVYICQTKHKGNMKTKHQTVAKTLRYAGYKAKCIFNGLMEQPYEIQVKGISRNEANELQQRFCDMLKDGRINIINI